MLKYLVRLRLLPYIPILYSSHSLPGTDLSAIQSPWYAYPTIYRFYGHAKHISRVPPNVIFEIDDYETDWSYSSGFDFIHSRELMGFIGDHDRFMAQAYENLNPGGWLEMQTTDPTLFSVDGGMERAKILPSYIANLHRASAMFGKSMTEVDTWPSRMVRAGFKDVQVQILTVFLTCYLLCCTFLLTYHSFQLVLGQRTLN